MSALQRRHVVERPPLYESVSRARADLTSGAYQGCLAFAHVLQSEPHTLRAATFSVVEDEHGCFYWPVEHYVCDVEGPTRFLVDCMHCAIDEIEATSAREAVRWFTRHRCASG